MKERKEKNFTQDKTVLPGGHSEMPRFIGNAKSAAKKGTQEGSRRQGENGAPGKQGNRAKAASSNAEKQVKQAAPAERGKRMPKRGKVKNPVKILFLGGVGEIGKNMTAIECGNDILIIDAGLTFPDEELPGGFIVDVLGLVDE